MRIRRVRLVGTRTVLRSVRERVSNLRRHVNRKPHRNTSGEE